MQNRTILKWIFIVFILADLSFSFLQYYQTPLFGDIQGGVLPEPAVQEVLDDPLGFSAIQTEEKHVNPNRFFSHYLLMKYFRNVPLFIQNFTSPINSVYLSSAIAKLVVQILFIYCITSLITNRYNPLNHNYIVAAAIVTPMFQSHGFWSTMGIIDKSIAYTFFYGIPIVLTMLFLLPILLNIIYKRTIPFGLYFLLFPFIIILPLSGPLIPGILLIMTCLIVSSRCLMYAKQCNNNINCLLKRIPKSVYILLLPISIWSMYSLYLGTYDSNLFEGTISIGQRYLRLPNGIYREIFHALGVPLMLVVIGINIYLLKKQNLLKERATFLYAFKWIILFSLIYIFLLPFGGYRPYRPFIIRHDTIIPVTTVLIFFFAASSFNLLQSLQNKSKRNYLILLIFVLLTFSIADIKGLGRNKCERKALKKIAQSKEKIVSIPKDCFVLSWANNSIPQDSKMRAELLYYWNITPEVKLFYNEK
nr:hypothetical protein [uncultured Draconibacterium sp.]